MATVEKRVGTNGQLRWRAKVRRDGAPDFTATFDTRSTALAWADSIESRIRPSILKATTEEARLLSLADSSLLVLIARGKVDFRVLAVEELRARGLDQRGTWVGIAAVKGSRHGNL